MAREETLYKLSEACLATGLKRSTFSYKRQLCNIPANRNGYTLEQIKQILMARSPGTARMSKRKAQELREKLKLDGYLGG